MNASNNTPYVYQVGGTLKPNAPYVWRQADDDIYASLQSGEFCYVFNCRQMGKSSLRAKVMQRLQAEGVSCAAIDLSKMCDREMTAAQWYGALIEALHRIFKLSKLVDSKLWLADHEQVTPLQQLSLYIEEVLLEQLGEGRIVIFIDEIDSVLKLKFQVSEFFSLIRACYNEQADNPAYERLTFVLLGAVKPADLVQDAQHTPFNIGNAIALEGLEFFSSAVLAEGLVGKAENPNQVLHEILRWTGGQPFLTQKLCKSLRNQTGVVILAGEEAEKVQQLVKATILDNWEFQDDPPHLRTIRDRLLDKEQKEEPLLGQKAGRLLGLYQQILEQGEIKADGRPEQIDLLLTGSVVKRGNKLEVYNPIYREVFNLAWVEEELTQLRPALYSEGIKDWLGSGKTDESRLLRGLALQQAQDWAKNISLGDNDYQFLRASEQLEAGAEREAKTILAEANRKAKQMIRIGSAVLIVSLIAATVAGVRATIAVGKLDEKTQELEQKADLLEAADIKLQKLNRQIIHVKGQGEGARKRLDEAEKNHNLALKLQKQAAKQTLLAKGNQAKAEEARRQAELDLARAENERQTATKKIEVVQYEVKKLEEKRGIIEQQLKLSKIQLKQSKYEHQIALKGTNLEQQGTSILSRFRAGSQSQIEILFEAMKTGQDLYNLIENDRSIRDYPATSPLLSLNTILQEIKEKNYLDFAGNGFAGNREISGNTFSPNGKYLAAASIGGIIKIWNLKSNQIVDLNTRQKGLFTIIFSPNSKYLATASNDGLAKLWDLNGNQISVFKGHNAGVSSVAFSPDGEYLAIGSIDGAVKLWNLKGDLISEFKSHKAGISSVAFSPNGEYLAIGSIDGAVKLRNLKNDQISEFKGYRSGVNSVAFSPNSKYLAIYVKKHGEVTLWDLNSNRIYELNGHYNWLDSIVFSPNGKFLVTGSGGTVKLWNLKGYKISEFKGDLHRLDSVAFSPNGEYLATGSIDGAVKLWNLKGDLISEFKGHKAGVKSVAFSPSGEYLSSGSDDGTLKLWDLKNNQVSKFNDDLVSSIAFSPNGKYIATSGITAKLRDSKGNLITEFKNAHIGFSSVIFSPDSKYLITGSNDGIVKLRDLEGNQITEFNGDSSMAVNVPFAFNGKYLAAGSTNDGTVKLWDLKENQILKFKAHESGVRSIAFSPNGKYIATGSGYHSAKLWDFKGNEIAEYKGHRSGVNSLAFSSNGKFLVTGSGFSRGTASRDITAKLWNLNGKLITEFKGHQRGVTSVAFSPNDKYLATGSDDGITKLWNLNGNLIAEFKGHQGKVNSVVFSPNGKYLATASNTVHLWKLRELPDLLHKGCDWLTDYLSSHPKDPQAQEVREICQKHKLKTNK